MLTCGKRKDKPGVPLFFARVLVDLTNLKLFVSSHDPGREELDTSHLPTFEAERLEAPLWRIRIGCCEGNRAT